MQSYDKALAAVLQNLPGSRAERLPLLQVRNRILAEPLRAEMDLPPFDKSLMDGYALRSIDLERGLHRLRVVEEIAAGDAPELPIGLAEAAEIMTGAPLPKGADAVQKVEETERVGANEVLIQTPVGAGTHVLRRGEEARKGEELLAKGNLLGPVQMGMLAAHGRDRVWVFAAPRVTIVPTGDELVRPGEKPGKGQIRDSSTTMLSGQIEEVGGKVSREPILPDDREQTRALLQRLREPDFLLFTGGLSMGEFDFVHQVLEEEEIEIIFHKIAIKPGKPFLFARRGRQVIFGLPGNPVSSAVTFEVLIRPALRRFMGFQEAGPNWVSGRLTREAEKKPGRLFFAPAESRLEGGSLQVEPVRTVGSADLTGFARANSLFRFEADETRLEVGAAVEVLPLSSSFPGGKG